MLKATIRTIEICEVLGIKNTVSHAGCRVGISKEDWFRENKAFYEKLFLTMERCGVNVLCENSAMANIGEGCYYLYTGRDMREFIAYVGHPQFGGCWDTGHANMEGAQHEEILALGDKLWAIHYNDNHDKKDDHVAPFLGCMNHDEIMCALIDVGFAGYFTLESDSSLIKSGKYTEKRGPFAGESRLREPQLFMQRHIEAMMYDTAKWILEQYNLFACKILFFCVIMRRKRGLRTATHREGQHMYLYETHLHTAPTSACARASVRETLEFYRTAGYAGVFMTNHFLDSNIDHALCKLSYEARIEGFFEATLQGQSIGREIGLSVFSGFEMSYNGTDFLVYGIDKAWCLAHVDMDKMPKSEVLPLMMAEGALVVQAHPFREAGYIDHIRLFPRCVQGVEIYNACRTEFENRMATEYAKNYGLLSFAGSDNHIGAEMPRFGGMVTDTLVKDERDFISKVLSGEAKPFIRDDLEFRVLT